MKIARWAVCGVLCLGLDVWSGFECSAWEDADEVLSEDAVPSEMEMVVELLNDEDNEMRSLGLDLVRSGLEGQKATEQLVALLPSLAADAKVGLISALADRGDLAARPAVLELISGDDDSARIAAIQALGSLGEAADTTLLVKMLAEVSDAEKKAARASLVQLQGEGVLTAMVEELKKAESPTQIALIEILASRRALDAVPDVLALTASDNQPVRAAAMESLGELAGPEHIAGMVQGILRADPKERANAEKAVAAVCARGEDVDRRAEPLLAVYETLNQEDQRTLLSTLGRVGGLDVLMIIEAALADGDSQLHGLGIRAICNWPDASIAPRLLDLATNDEHDSHRTSALRALIRVAPLRDDRDNTERLEILKKAMSMATRDDERHLVLQRAGTVLDIEALRFVVPYMDQPAHVEQACLGVVELAHNVGLREPNKAEFHQALDRVIVTSEDPVVVDRAGRYKKGQTWYRPAKPTPPPPAPKPAAVSVGKPTEPESTPAEAQSSEQDVESEEKPDSMWLFFVIGGVIVLALICLHLASRR